MRLSWREVVGATRGRILGGVDSCAPATGWSIDTRSLERGDCFFAIVGPRQDGHRFVGAAVAAGAAAVVVSDPAAAAGLPASCLGLCVDDTTRALQDLAAHVRRRARVHVVAITGSVGKTTTKELTGLLLQTTRRTHVSPGNLNNHYGLPLALLRMPEATEVAVLEMGISTPGEMDRLLEIAEPDHGLVTLISPAHVGNFDCFADYAEEKMKLPRGSRVALLNADDEEQVSRRAGLPPSTCELGMAATGPRALRIAGLESRGLEGSTLQLEREGLAFELACPLPGAHQARNLAAATALALELGVEVPVLRSQAALARPSAHRGEPRCLHVDGGRALLVDDSYNANPEAMRAAVELLCAAPEGRRRILVAGDMLELGQSSAEEHRSLGRLAARSGLDLLLGVGKEMALAVEAARAAGLESAHVVDAEAAADWLVGRLRPDDVVLVKGSRGIALDRTVERLVAERRAS